MIVSKKLSMTNNDISQTTENKLDIAIRDAEGEIELLSRNRKRLQQAIRIFRANKRDGVPWPGGEKNADLS